MKKYQESKYLRDLGEELEKLSLEESRERKNSVIKYLLIAAAIFTGLFFAMKGFRGQAFFLTLFVVVGVEFFEKITSLWFTCTYRKWPTTTGKIIIQPKVVEVVRTLVSSMFHHGEITPPIRYKISVKYEYEVGMDTYTGKRISFSEQIWYSQKDAQKQADEFKRGEEVTVRYHPMWPKISVAESRGMR